MIATGLLSSIRQVRRIEAAGKKRVRAAVAGWPPNLNQAVEVLDQIRWRRAQRQLAGLIKDAR